MLTFAQKDFKSMPTFNHIGKLVICLPDAGYSKPSLRGRLLMKDTTFQGYSRKQVHFYGRHVPPMLRSTLNALNVSGKKFRLLDVGCGDGNLIFALCQEGLLENAEEIVGVDISEDRIERLKANLLFVKAIVANALDIGQLNSSSFDFVVCTQLIEHVVDEDRLLAEIRRLLKHGSFAYVSSVIKRRWGIYFYFKNGSFRLDPTHVREYSSEKEFVDVLVRNGFEIANVQVRPLSYPLLDLAVRSLIRTGFAEPDVGYYQRHADLGRLRVLRLPVMGYETVEALVKNSSI
jgi:2-polyprenyl-3-methyl-5-hydroxy-6-metoxy-1,4-benzoquinol methylase